jgi:hypothetical protein
MRSHMKREDFEQFKTVYKYRACEDDNGWRILENQEIWFSSPASFNDPFDCNFWVRYDLLSDEELYQAMRAVVVREANTQNADLIEALTQQAIDGVRNSEKYEEATKLWIERNIDFVGVFCASVEPDNILLWSHYAYNHTGYAIGFNREALYDMWKEANGIILGGPIYDSEYPVFLPSDIEPEKQQDTWIQMVNRKSALWEYEKELRMIIRADGRRARKFQPTIVDEVVLGAKIKPLHKQRLLAILDAHYPSTAVYQAGISRDAFALTLTKIK